MSAAGITSEIEAAGRRILNQALISDLSTPNRLFRKLVNRAYADGLNVVESTLRPWFIACVGEEWKRRALVSNADAPTTSSRNKEQNITLINSINSALAEDNEINFMDALAAAEHLLQIARSKFGDGARIGKELQTRTEPGAGSHCQSISHRPEAVRRNVARTGADERVGAGLDCHFDSDAYFPRHAPEPGLESGRAAGRGIRRMEGGR